MITRQFIRRAILVVAPLALSPLTQAFAFIDGISGTNFKFAAREGRISVPDGTNQLFWGFADITAGPTEMVQYPGPTLILTQGQTVTITLTNELKEPVSMMFPGMTMVTPTTPVFTGGSPKKLSSLVPEAAPGGTQTYTFTATKAGTFYYQSGSNQAIQLRMGLFGAIIVRPTTYKTLPIHNKVPFGHYSSNNGVREPQVRLNYNDTNGIGGVAYNPSTSSDMSTVYDREFLFLASEMDPKFQQWMEFGRAQGQQFDMSTWKANLWFINGRNAPDTMGMPFIKGTKDSSMSVGNSILPSQPYNCMPLFHPGERVLIRIINMGQEYHPLHTHGNHLRVVAEDGNLLSSNPVTSGADLAWQAFTVTMAPGKTMDAIFTWTGEKLGWDIYADTVTYRPYEYMPDHGKTYQPYTAPALVGSTPKLPSQGLPVFLPTVEETLAGQNWSGSPYLGTAAPLPPGEGGFNPLNGFFFMWHSHSERELTNNNIFPGGFLTMAGVVPWPATGDNLTPEDDYILMP
jgi:manganese oxidase